MQQHPDRLEIRKGGGCLAIFGLPFMLAGLAVMTSPLWGPMQDDSGNAAPLLFVIPFGFVFFAVGAGLVLGRAGVVLDRRAGTVSTWWGLLGPFKTRTRPLDMFRLVWLGREVRRNSSSKGGSSTTIVYPVRLICEESPPQGLIAPDEMPSSIREAIELARELAKAQREMAKERREKGAEPVDIAAPMKLSEARAEAEKVSAFLGLPIADTVAGEVRLREPGELNESLRQRAARLGGGRALRPQPQGARIQAHIHGAEATFHLPRADLSLRALLPLAMGLIMFLVFAFFVLGTFSRNTDISDPAFLPVLIFMGVIAAIILVPLGLGIVSALTLREEVTASAQALEVVRRTALGEKRTRLAADEIEELDMGKASRLRESPLMQTRGLAKGVAKWAAGRALYARTDKEQVVFGQGLEYVELEWLRDTLHYILTADTR